MKKILIAFLALVMVCLPLAGCQDENSKEYGLPKAGSYPMTITDGNGIEVTIESEPQTIISLAPSCTETLFAIGAGDMVVADSTYCNYPEAAAELEKVGDTYSVDVERIIELNPDIVFVAGSFATDVQDTLTQAGIAVYSTNEIDMDDIYYSIMAFGVITNHEDEASDVVTGMKSDLEELQSEVKGATSKKVFIDLGMLYSSSGLSFQGNLFGLIGAENIALDYDTSAPQLTSEEVISANPDVYICMSSKDYYVQPDGFDQLAAFQEGNVYYIDYLDPLADIISRPGPRVVEGLRALATMIYPELNIESDYITDLADYK